MPIDALSVLCAQLTRDMLATAKFLLTNGTLYQSSKTLKTIGVPIVTGPPRLYQQCTTVYQSSKTVKKSKHSQNSTKMTISVPVVTCLPRLYQQCNNSLLIVNKNLAIANRSRVSCAHNTSRAFIGLNITP